MAQGCARETADLGRAGPSPFLLGPGAPASLEKPLPGGTGGCQGLWARPLLLGSRGRALSGLVLPAARGQPGLPAAGAGTACSFVEVFFTSVDFNLFMYALSF